MIAFSWAPKNRYPCTSARVTCDSLWNLRRTTWVDGTVLRLEEYAVLSLSRRGRDHLRVLVVNHVGQPVAGGS